MIVELLKNFTEWIDSTQQDLSQLSNPLTDCHVSTPRAELGGLYLRMRQSDWSGMVGLCW